MGRQTSLLTFTGRAGNLIGYHRDGKHFMRCMPETVRQTSATRQAAQRFGAENISAGESLATPLEASGQFPADVVEMIAVAESALIAPDAFAGQPAVRPLHGAELRRAKRAYATGRFDLSRADIEYVRILHLAEPRPCADAGTQRRSAISSSRCMRQSVRAKCSAVAASAICASIASSQRGSFWSSSRRLRWRRRRRRRWN